MSFKINHKLIILYTLTNLIRYDCLFLNYNTSYTLICHLQFVQTVVCSFFYVKN